MNAKRVGILLLALLGGCYGHGELLDPQDCRDSTVETPIPFVSAKGDTIWVKVKTRTVVCTDTLDAR